MQMKLQWNKMKITGLNELEQKLKKIEKIEAKKIIRKAVREAQKIDLAASKDNAKSMVGGEMGNKIASALKIKAVNKQRKGSYALQVAIDPTQAEEFVHNTKGGTRYYIPTAIEYGHRKKGGGTVPSIPFMLISAEINGLTPPSQDVHDEAIESM